MTFEICEKESGFLKFSLKKKKNHLVLLLVLHTSLPRCVHCYCSECVLFLYCAHILATVEPVIYIAFSLHDSKVQCHRVQDKLFGNNFKIESKSSEWQSVVFLSRYCDAFAAKVHVNLKLPALKRKRIGNCIPASVSLSLSVWKWKKKREWNLLHRKWLYRRQKLLAYG